MSYLSFVRANPRFLGFGFALTFFSSFGQTFFISLFAAELRSEFGLGHGAFGSLYSAATLASGMTLIWLGRKIDTVDLRLFSSLVTGGLVVACLFFAWTPSLLVLPVAFYALRLSAQGLMGHAAITSMARYFDAHRGKAISIAMLGWPAGEAVFPILAVTAMGQWGWRATWVGTGAILAVILVPLTLWLLRGQEERHRRHVEAIARPADGDGATPVRRQWTRGEVLRDPRFWLVLPAALAPMFVMTGFFFHQVHLADTKGWSLAWLASCFVGFAATQTVGGLVAGPLVDRVSAHRLLPLMLWPMGAGLLVVAGAAPPAFALVYMTFAGLTGGMAGTVNNALWAEMYGTLHLGAIRALMSALGVTSTALSPVTMGWMIDRGVSMEVIALLCVGYVAIGSAATVVAFRPRLQPA